MGYLLLSFYSSNSVKMLISQIRRGRVCVYVYEMVSHPAKCMYERRAHLTALQTRSVLACWDFIVSGITLHSNMD